MTTIGDLPTPALLLDLDRLEANLEGMAARARALGVNRGSGRHRRGHGSSEAFVGHKPVGKRLGEPSTYIYSVRVGKSAIREGGGVDKLRAFPLQRFEVLLLADVHLDDRHLDALFR